jgi:oligopeptide/dipeptide ABC transporter ATP-binding protein
MTQPEILLRVHDLRTTFFTQAGPIRAVDGISFSVARGERLGLAGESGSGKSVTALTIMGLVQTPSARVEGSIVFDGRELMGLPERSWRSIRGNRIAMIFQDPMNSLDPAMTVGAQIAEAIRAHEPITRRAARQRAVELLRRVGIPSPRRSADEYPHRFSGGMRQRVMIAMAMSCEPDLLIADEPTTALDVTIQSQILDLLASLSEENDVAVILITHDLGIMAGFAQRTAVMYAGRLVEEGSTDTIFYRSTHPYTWGLLASIIHMDEAPRARLPAIEGSPPSPMALPDGCRFHPRCPYREPLCAEEPPRLEVHPGDTHASACHFAGRLAPPAVLRRMRSA